MAWKLYTDGGSRNNPGQAATGFVLLNDKGVEVVSEGRAIGIATNNEAEYQALIHGLEAAHRHKVTELDCLLDSLLVVKQMNREYKIKDVKLAKLFVKVWNLIPHFKKVTFNHIPRSRNKRADELVNTALDKLE